MTDTLRNILRKNTYIVWPNEGDTRMWSRLRAAIRRVPSQDILCECGRALGRRPGATDEGRRRRRGENQGQMEEQSQQEERQHLLEY